MKYGITYANGAAENFTDCGEARSAFALARGAMFAGEEIALWSESATGARMNMAIVRQPVISDISAIMN